MSFLGQNESVMYNCCKNYKTPLYDRKGFSGYHFRCGVKLFTMEKGFQDISKTIMSFLRLKNNVKSFDVQTLIICSLSQN